MMRRLLVAMDGSPHGEAAGALAIDWAHRFGADLVVLGVLDEPAITGPEPVPMGAMGYKVERDDMRLAEAHLRIHDFLGAFRRRCEVAHVPCAVIEDIGTPHEQIVLQAARCDVVVLGKESHFRFETDDNPDTTLLSVLTRSPRPVIVVPRQPADGEGVLVAYGTGREEVRTLQTFTLLGLAAGETVDVLAIDSDRAEAELRARLAGDYLAAHDVRHRLVPLATDAEPADVIVEEVRHRRPRLLVMGAPGYHPLRDLLFGSVTRVVLKETSVPVFAGA
jgi:nucleotide-binding universal stress UspA family protein